MSSSSHRGGLQACDALIVVDVQNDFLPGGALPVPHGDEVIPKLNQYIHLFQEHHRPVIATRDWHPSNHCSFRDFGGRWPPHCIANSPGARFAPSLQLPSNAIVISKGTAPEREAYSGFQETPLRNQLLSADIERLFVGGLATDYCVLHTVDDALQYRFKVFVLLDAIQGVNADPKDSAKALREMQSAGAIPICLSEIVE